MEDQYDSLGVLEGARWVVEQATEVRIAPEAVEAVAERLHRERFTPPAWNYEAHFYDGTERTVTYLLVLDALNFSFWGEPRWKVQTPDGWVDGYWALTALLKRGLAEGVPLLDAAYLATMPAADLARLARGQGSLPLAAERRENLHEVGRVLLEKYDGHFARTVEQAGQSAVRLVKLVVHDFPSFNDVARYKGQEVRFYKRAQILVGDLYGTFAGQDWGHFTDSDQLTAFADYKVPQVLRRLGMLVYTPVLAARLDRREQLAPGSPAEVEIRAATIWAVELLRQTLARRGLSTNAFMLDWHLWQLGQEPSAADRPYHLTRTIYY